MGKLSIGSASVGIDLGTTYSSIAYVDRRETEKSKFIPRPVKLAVEEGSPFCVPSRAVFLPDGRVEVDIYGRSLSGVQAVDVEIEEEFKLKLGESSSYGQGTRPWRAAVAVLKFLKEKAEEEVGQIQEAVIAVPSYGRSGEMAYIFQKLLEDTGLGVHIVDETIAALCYVDFLEGGIFTYKPKHVMVIDYGGGTCNVTIAQVSYPLIMGSQTLTPLSAKSEKVGGYLVDEALVQWVQANFREAVDSFSLVELRHLVRKAKEKTCRLYQSLLEEDGDRLIRIIEDQERPYWTLSMFESIIRSKVKEIIRPISGALQEARQKMGDNFDIDTVFLVGGSSNMPMTETVVTDFFKRCLVKKEISKIPNIRRITPSSPLTDLEFEAYPLEVIRDPRLAVSCGAALHRFYRNIGRRRIVDRLPIYLELETSDGKRTTLLKKRVEIPTRRPRSRLFRMERTREVRLALYTRREKESPSTHYYEKVFKLDQELQEGTLLRVDVDVDVCRRVELSIRPWGKKEPKQTDVIPRALGD